MESNLNLEYFLLNFSCDDLILYTASGDIEQPQDPDQAYRSTQEKATSPQKRRKKNPKMRWMKRSNLQRSNRERRSAVERGSTVEWAPSSERESMKGDRYRADAKKGRDAKGFKYRVLFLKMGVHLDF